MTTPSPSSTLFPYPTLFRSGFGAVYRARNRFEQNQPPRAIKFCLDPAVVDTLHRERAILDRLTHAGETNWSHRIVRLYGYALRSEEHMSELQSLTNLVCRLL